MNRASGFDPESGWTLRYTHLTSTASSLPRREGLVGADLSAPPFSTCHSSCDLLRVIIESTDSTGRGLIRGQRGCIGA
jgi:hypothetical protein